MHASLSIHLRRLVQHLITKITIPKAMVLVTFIIESASARHANKAKGSWWQVGKVRILGLYVLLLANREKIADEH